MPKENLDASETDDAPDRLWVDFRLRRMMKTPVCLMCESVALTGSHDRGCAIGIRRHKLKKEYAMGSQDQHRDDDDFLVDVPDFPPPPNPGDLVVTAFEKDDELNDTHWANFMRGVRRWLDQWNEMADHIGRGVQVSPLWRKEPAEQLQHEADRLEGLYVMDRREGLPGNPEWRLWKAYAQETRLR